MNRTPSRIPVLVIEKDDDLREFIRYNLYLDGFEVYTAADGPSGIEAASKYKLRLILLEEEDGLETLSTFKQDSDTRHIPVIMLTPKSSIVVTDEASEILADDYIKQPFEGSRLGKIVKEKLKKCENATKKKRRSNKIPVLVIDDDVSWRKLVEYHLRSDGFEVYTAQDGPSGIEATLKHKPRLILLDVMMPEMNGLEVLSKLKHDSRTRRIPVFMLTSKNSLGDIDRAFNVGADDYITKPFVGSKLGKTIKKKLKKCKDATNKTQRLKKISVLVIDDDVSWCKEAEHNLSMDGFKVHTAADGASGIKAALKYKPRLILLDIMMPGMDGLEVLSTLKHNPRTSRIPVIMLTAKSIVEDIDRAFEIGADDYISKPFEGGKLRKVVKERLGKHGKVSVSVKH